MGAKKRTRDPKYWEQVVVRGLEREASELRSAAAPESLRERLPAVSSMQARRISIFVFGLRPVKLLALVACLLMLLATPWLWRAMLSRPSRERGRPARSFASLPARMARPGIAEHRQTRHLVARPSIGRNTVRRIYHREAAFSAPRLPQRSVFPTVIAANTPVAVFPTPVPPSGQEKLLVILLASHPSASVLVALQPPPPPSWAKDANDSASSITSESTNMRLNTP